MIKSIFLRPSMPDISLVDKIISHDEYFSRIISMIPSDLYRPPSIDPVVANSKFYKHRRMPLEPNERKLISKQNKLKKYDPNYQTMDESDEEEEEEENKSEQEDINEVDMDNKDEEEEEEDHKHNRNHINSKIQSKVNTIKSNQENKETLSEGQTRDRLDGLRERLQNRISLLKSDRNIKKLQIDPESNGDIAILQKEQKSNPSNQPRSPQKSNSSNHSKLNGNNMKDRNMVSTGNNIREQLMNLDSSTATTISTNSAGDDYLIDSMSGDIDYAIGINPNKRKLKDLGKPGSKMKRLQQMAEEVEKKRRRLESYRNQGEIGKQLIENEKWNDVIASASGERATIDGSKVKKAIKRIEKNKAKSSKEWKVRIEEVANKKQTQNEKREQNLQNRKLGIKLSGHSNTSNNTNNKGLHVIHPESPQGRPGFEGKKTEFLNQKKPNTSSNK